MASPVRYLSKFGLASSCNRFRLIWVVCVVASASIGAWGLGEQALRVDYFLDSSSFADGNDVRCPDPVTSAVDHGEPSKLEELLAAKESLQDCHVAFWVRSFAYQRARVDGTLMHLAAARGHLNIVEVLLANGFAPNALTKEVDSWCGNATALMFGAAIGHKEVVLRLLRTGEADINHQSQAGFSALMLAVEWNRVEVVDSLLAATGIEINAGMKGGKTPGFTALMLAVLHGYKQQVLGSLLNRPDLDVNRQAEDGQTALILAARYGRTQAVDQLISTTGIDVDVNMAENTDGATALVWAAVLGSPQELQAAEIAKALLAAPTLDPNKPRKDGETALMLAAYLNHVKVVQVLLTSPKLEPNMENKDGRTALMLAVYDRAIEASLCLMEHPRVDVNYQDKDGVSALMIAAVRGSGQITEALLNVSDIDVALQSKQEGTALMVAAKFGQSKVAQVLLEDERVRASANATKDDGTTALMVAARYGNTEVVQALLSNYSDSEYDVGLNFASPQDKMTAMMWAAKEDAVQVAAALCEKKANLELRNKDDMTAVMLAAKHNSFWVIQILIAHCRADCNAIRNKKDNATALMIAAESGNTQAVKYLLQSSQINGEAQNEDQKTALMLSAERGYPEVVKELLLSGKIDATTKGEGGKTALHLAAQNGHWEAVEALLNFSNTDRDALGTALTKDGDNALMLAAARGYLHMSQYLFHEVGFDLGHQNEAGLTVLHHAMNASSHDTESLVHFLVEQNKSNVNTTTKANVTALQMAVNRSHVGIVHELLEHRASPYHEGQGENSALRIALGNGDYIITKMLLESGASAERDISDTKGKRLAVWFGVEFSMVELLRHYADTSSSWMELWKVQGPQFNGDMKGVQRDMLMRHAKSAAVVHELLDWQQRVDEQDPETQGLEPGSKFKYDPGLRGESKQAVSDALMSAWFNESAEATMALLARGAGQLLQDAQMNFLKTRNPHLWTSSEEVGDQGQKEVELKLAKDWNRLHWSAQSCDLNALSLAMKYPMGKLVGLLDQRGTVKGREQTPIEVARSMADTNLRCLRSSAIFEKLEVLKAMWKVQVANEVASGSLAAIACVGALALKLFFLRLKTLQQNGFFFMASIPAIFCLTGAWIALIPRWDATADVFMTSTGSQTSTLVRQVVGWAVASAGVVLLLGVCTSFVGTALADQLQAVKKRGTHLADRFWEKLDFGLGWLLVAALFLRMVQLLPMGLEVTGLLAGLAHGLAATWPLVSASHRWVSFLLHLSPGLVFVLISLTNLGIGAHRNSEHASPPAQLLIGTCFALAWADIPGIVTSVASRVSAVVEIEMAAKLADNRFTANKLILGRAAIAAHGIDHALGLTQDAISAGLRDPIGAMKEEILATGDSNDLENFKYIVEGTSGRPADYPSAVKVSLDTGIYHGGELGPNDFDTGHGGRDLAAWMQVPEVVLANLTQAEFVAVRFYTSSSFPKINGPLRKEVRPHPWAMVVYLLDRGIKKLRSVQAQVDPELFAGQTVLWRGMKNLEVDISQFAAVGGTEMAPMSTTTNEDVARHYASSKVPLVFKYVVGGLKTGVSIQFLSLYPKEEEFLYAPLTFLSLKSYYEDDGTTILVVEPVMS